MSTTVDTARLEITTNADEYAAQTKKISDATKGMSVNVGRSALEASRALEDFQYGVGGVVNNIPGLVGALGGGAGAMAAFSLGAVALNQVAKHWDDILGVFQKRTEIPKATDELKELEGAIQRNNKALEEFKDKTTLSNDELARYNELTAKGIALEKEQKTAREAREREERVAKLENPEVAEANAERKQILKDGLGGQQGDLAASVARSLNTANDNQRAILEGVLGRATERANQTTGDDQKFFLEQITETKKAIAALPTVADRMKEATTIVAKALDTGDLAAFRDLQDHAIDRPELFTDQQRRAITSASPETAEEMAKIDEADLRFDLGNERWKSFREKRDKKEKERIKKADEAAREAENDPATKQKQLELTAAGFPPAGTKDTAKAVRDAKAELAKQRKTDNTLTDQASPETAQRNTRAFQERQLAQNILRNSAQATGIQFTPEQAQEASKATMDMVAKNVDFNAALGAALAEQIQTTTALANRLRQQQMGAMQLQNQARQVNQFLQQPMPPNLWGGF